MTSYSHALQTRASRSHITFPNTKFLMRTFPHTSCAYIIVTTATLLSHLYSNNNQAMIQHGNISSVHFTYYIINRLQLNTERKRAAFPEAGSHVNQSFVSSHEM